jgi:hypothetical protein
MREVMAATVLENQVGAILNKWLKGGNYSS